MDFRDFVLRLDEATKKKEDLKGVYSPEELTPVEISGTPKGQEPGKGAPPPAAKGPQPDEVEVIRIGAQPKGKDDPGEQKGPKVKESEKSDKETPEETKDCPDCDGTGKDKEDKEGDCPTCGGSGKVDKKTGEPATGKPAPKEGEATITREYHKPTAPSPSREKQLPKTFDSHDILDKGDASEAKDIAGKILDKGEEKRKERGEEGSKDAGGGYGGFIDKLRGIYKPKIDWVRELKEKIRAFKSKSAKTIDRYSRELTARYKEGKGHIKTKAYATWLREPKSHSVVKGQPPVLFKGPYVKAPIAEVVLIIALDTSGSIPARTVEKVFGEMDKIANTFKQGIGTGTGKMEGRVYLMMWDWGVTNIKEYKPGDWKKYAEGKEHVTGGGGTDADVVFEYLNKHFKYDPEVSKKTGILNLIEAPTKSGVSKNDIAIPVKESGGKPSAEIAPFVVVATDGYFAKNVTEKDMGILFKDNLDSIVYLIIDGIGDMAYPKNIIKYESYRV